jgi:Co/Zn/Cd efflux system component
MRISVLNLTLLITSVIFLSSCALFGETKKEKADREAMRIKREKMELEYERQKRFQNLHDKGATSW